MAKPGNQLRGSAARDLHDRSAMTDTIVTIAVAVAALLFAAAYGRRYLSREKRARQTLEKTREAGLEPVSLHPTVDPNRCISTGACAEACPERDVIGIVHGMPELINPTRCIGHGACAAACPVGAITLVFGTERRGVDIPYVRDTFETNIDGVYIAGELGGMGLIRNAVTQGKQAVGYAGRGLGGRDPAVHDIAIVGAGPAGMAATLEAKKRGFRYVTLEQEETGGALLSYPRQKIVMTQPMDLPLYGKCRFTEIAKEELLDIFRDVLRKTGVEVRTRERVEEVTRRNGHFEIRSNQGVYAASKVLLTIGRRGTPRKLSVPGEESSKVTYKLIDAEQYAGKSVLVVGGGDSAVEAALALARQPGTRVDLSYRRNAFPRIKDRNRELLDQTVAAKKVAVLLESEVKSIERERVHLEVAGKPVEIANDYVIVSIGGEVPTEFLQRIGIRTETKFGKR